LRCYKQAESDWRSRKEVMKDPEGYDLDRPARANVSTFEREKHEDTLLRD
jgi:hypothetical protein